MKEILLKKFESLEPQLQNMANFIFDNPEFGLKEFKASNLLINYLEENGFIIEKGVGGLETAFRAIYEQGTDGPSIGILVEYDAIEGIGHACGHHMQGPIGVGVAVALKEVLKTENYKLVVYGTPAEETTGGKLAILKNGCFKDIDVALMTHGGPNTTTDIKSLAMCKLTVTFNGIKSHAALKPESGRSAFDALLLTFNAIEFMREHVPDDVRMHYTVLNAGGPANVVPDKAVGNFYLRSYDNATLVDCKERFFNIIKGASLMTGTTYDIHIDKEMGGKIPILTLNDLIMKNALELNAPSMSPPREKTGSTDFGSVMAIVPGTCLRIAFVPEGTASHSDEYLKAGKSPEAYKAIDMGGKILLSTIYEIITDKEVLKSIKDEFERKTNKK